MTDASNPSDVARETLRQLALRRQQPTPDNFRAIYHEIAGTVAPDNAVEAGWRQVAKALPRDSTTQLRLARRVDGAAGRQDWGELAAVLAELASSGTAHNWGSLIRDVLMQLEQRHAGLTAARKRAALDHVFSASGKDSDTLFERLQALLKSWSQNQVQAADSLAPEAQEVLPGGAALAPSAPQRPAAASAEPAAPVLATLREDVAHLLENGVHVLLSEEQAMAERAGLLANEVRRQASPDAALSQELRKFAHDLQWVAEDQTGIRSGLQKLLLLLVQNIDEIVVDNQWLQGQVSMLSDMLARPASLHALADMERRLKEVIYKQSQLRKSLVDAQQRLKDMLAGFVSHLADFTDTTGDYHGQIERYAERISSAHDLAELSDVTVEVLRQTRSVQVFTKNSLDGMTTMKSRVEQAEQQVSRLEQELARTSEMVRHDHLTGSLNRKGLDEAFESEAQRARRRASPLAVGLLDLDNFKKLNDSLGHQAGDQALIYLASAIRDTLRPNDTCARYGGEEFVILMPDTEVDGALAAMTRLQRELTRRIFLHENEKVLITFSAGVTALAPDETAETAIARADAAMYRAKAAGKNRVLAG